MVVRVRYKPNNKEFGALMMSAQTQDLAFYGADAAKLEAGQIAMEAGLSEDYVSSIRVERGPVLTLGGNPRRTARVVVEHRSAAAIEFGSGQKRDRPQGGSSPAYRILGQAASKVGSPPGVRS